MGSTLTQPRTPKNVRAPIRAASREQPLFGKRNKVFGLTKTSLNRILHKDLSLHSYKIQMELEMGVMLHFQRLSCGCTRNF